MITVNSRRYDLTIRRSWTCELVEQRDSLLIFLGEFAEAVDHPDLGLIEKGTISYEYYWLDRWYNIFRFHQPSGELRSYYCNINMPPIFGNDELNYVDLDIDLLVHPDFSYRILDRDEFIENSRHFGYPDEIKSRVEATIDELIGIIDRRDVPGAPELFATSPLDRRGNA